MLLAQPSTGAQSSEAVVDLLYAMDGMPLRTPLLGAFAAGQGRSTTVR
jgi:hypothetical protein